MTAKAALLGRLSRKPALTYFRGTGLGPTIISPAQLNFRVRDGNGCDLRGRSTGKPATKFMDGFPMPKAEALGIEVKFE